MVPSIAMYHNSIKHQSFVYTQLNDQTNLFQAIQFSMSLVSTQSKCQTISFDLSIGLYQLLPSRARVDMGAMAIKEYSIFLKGVTFMQSHSQMVLCYIYIFTKSPLRQDMTQGQFLSEV